MFNKIFSLLLCIVMLTSVLVACDNARPNDEDTTVASTTLDESSGKEEYESSVDIDDTADTETIGSSDALSSDTATTDTESLPETSTETEKKPSIINPPGWTPDPPGSVDDTNYFCILADDTMVEKEFLNKSNGDLLQDAIISRQDYINDFLNIEIVITTINGGYANAEKYASELEAATGAGCPYDLALTHNKVSPLLAAKGLSLDLAKSGSLNLSNTTAPYWSDELLSDTAVGGRVFWISDNASYNNVSNMLCIIVNNEYFERINTGFTKKNLYSLVDSGAWTMENMFLLAQDAYDCDVIKESGQTIEDYGLNADGAGGRLDAWLYASGFRTTKMSHNGTYVWSLSDPTLIEFIDWWQGYLNDNDIYKGEGGTPYVMSREGRAMFSLLPLGALDERPFEFDLTILPMPLYKKSVKNGYSTPLIDGYSTYMIPKGVKSDAFELSTTVIELLAAEANRRIAPTFYEINIRRQVSLDDRDMERMFQYIRSSTVFDMGALYGDMLAVEAFGDKVSPSLAIRKIWAGDGTGDYADIETVWSKIEGTVTSKLKTIMTELLEY